MAVATTPALAVNILSNSGFETGSLAPWYQGADYGGPENWNVTSADAHTGTFSATDVGNKMIRQDFAPVATSLVTNVSFWLKNPDVVINAFVLFYDDSTEGSGLLFATSADWTFFDVTGSLAVGKNLVGVGVWGYSGGGAGEDRTYVDDYVVDVVPEPASMSVIGLGIAAFAARRKRR